MIAIQDRVNGTRRILIENPFRFNFIQGKFSNINFLEITGDPVLRKEYLSHGNAGIRYITELQALKILQSWNVEEQLKSLN